MAFDIDELRASTEPSLLEGASAQPMAQEQAQLGQEPDVPPLQPTAPATVDVPKEGIGPAVIVEHEDGRATLAPAVGADGLMLSTKQARVRAEQFGSYGTFLNADQARRWQAEHTSPAGKEGIRAALLTAKGIRPEQIARDKELAMRLGISPEQVHYAAETAEDEDFARQLEQFDRLAEFASRSPYHAAYARGFFDDLTKIEMEEAERHIAEREAKAQEWANPVAGAALKSMQMTFPNESSAKTIRGAIDRSKAQAVMSETSDRMIAAFYDGRMEDAERLRETLKMQSVALSQIGPEDEFDRSIASRIGLGYAFEQSHTSLPIMGKSLGIGALTGLGVVGAGAGIGALATGGPGAAAGARVALPKALKAGEVATIAASSYYTFYLERNLALPEILAMTDEAGHAMPMDIAIEAATAYGAVAAGLETVAEKAALGVLKPVSSLGRGPAARYIAKAIMSDPGLRAGAQAVGKALGPTGRIALGKLWQLGVAGSAEAFTEATQATSEVTARSWAAKTANWRIEGERASDPNAPAGSFDERILTPENLKQIQDEAKAGFAGGFWFGVLPAVASGVYHGVRVQSARNFADREIQRHATVEQSPLTQLDPSAMSEYLQTVAPELEQEVMIPMDRAVTLHQQGIDIISPFGVSIEEAQRAAASGQALNVPLSELHARLDTAQFNAAADIMQRRQVDAMAEEAQTSDEDLLRRLAQPLDNAERIEAARNAESWMTPEQRAAYGQEIERLRKEMRIAIQGVPNVIAQAEAQGGLEAYLEGVIVPLRRAASMLARRTGQNPADVARKIIVDSARRAQQAQANATAEERAAADIEAEFSEPVQEEPVQAAQEAAPAQEQAAEAEPVQTTQEAAPAQEAPLNEGPDELPPVPPEVQARWDAAEQASQAQEAPVQEQAQEVQPEAQAEELQAQAPEQEAPAEPVQANPRRAVGRSDSLAVSSGDEPFTYQVWELDDLIPSHDPTAGFQKRADYPQGVQERPYHSDRGEQEKVRRNAGALDPRYCINTNPDAMSGPPVVTPTGVVLGGNSRTMSIQTAYANGTEKAQAYRQAVIDNAQAFGIDPAAVSAMSQPVLVRVVDRAMSPLEMAQASRRYNEVTTQALQSEAEGVSKSKLVSERTLASFTADSQEFDTVREFLSSAKSRDFVQGLMDDGVIEPTQASRLTDAQTGLLNSEGKDLVVNTLRGLVIQDYDIISRASSLAPSVLDKIDRAIPDLVALRNRGGQWVKVVESLQEAVNQINKWLASGSDTFPHTLANLHLHFDQGGLLADPAKAKKAVNALAVTLATATSKEFQARVATMEAEARNASEKGAMASMLGEADKPVSPAGAFVRAFLKPVAVINGKAVRGFNPETNPLHEAMQWASENSGTAHTFEAAQSRLASILSDRKAPKEAKAEAKERLQKLSGREGKIYVYGRPMLGAFQYRKSLGDVLWQRMEEAGDARMDAEYMAAVQAGDIEVARRMVEARAREMGFEDAIPEQTEAYAIRTKPAPKKTKKAYKVFTIADDGSPTALFVGGTAKLPVGVWVDAVTPWHIINAKNGKPYVPSTQNPWTEGGKTGDTVTIRDEDRAELLKRGFIKKPSAMTVTGLAFRPGLHFGSLPVFPQGGKTAVGANWQIKGKAPLGMVHRYNQVVYEVEIDADHDFTDEARAQPKAQTKKGTINAQAADLQYMPEGGFYEYTTNPANMGHPERGVWYISDAMRIIRPLTQEECDAILAENGLPAQEWEGGEDGKSGRLDLNALNVNPEQNDAARKTLAPITYDEQGNVIPLSKRFDRSNPSVFYQSMPVPENPLVALHNIDADNLVASAKLGGLPVPSIGVTKAETPYSDFGGISLIGTRDLVDPAETPVFTRDAYTARFPHTSWKAPKQSDVSRVLKSALPYLQKYEDVQAYNFEYHLKYVPDRDAAIDLFLASSGGRAMYLESKGETVAPIMTEAPETAYCSRDPLVRSVAKHLIFKNNGKIPDEFTDGELRSLARAYREAVEKRNLDKDTERLMLDIVDDNGLMTKADAFDLVSAVKRDLNVPEGIVDKTATRRMLKAKVPLDDAGFREFAENLIGGIFKGQTISIGKREVPLTLDNVVRAMSSKQVRNQEHAGSQSFGPGELRAAAADRLSNVDEYNEYRDMLVDQETGNSAGGHFRNLLSDFDTNVRIYYKNDNAGGWYSDELRRALATFTGYKKGNLKSNLAKALKKHGFEKIDKDSDDSIVFELGEEMYWELKAGTATYMEAKPQRAVMLDEFLGAVIPSDTSDEARKVLAENGITVMEYKPGDLKDKRAKVSQLSSRLAQTQEAIILFQRAWHGSPFKFDRFTLAHIGEGEGAQVHGWGLYFAQSRKISDERYRRRLASGKRTITINGEKPDEETLEWLESLIDEQMTRDAIRYGEYEEIEKVIEENAKHAKQRFEEAKKTSNKFKSRITDARKKGATLESFVDVASEEESRYRRNLVRHAEYQASKTGEPVSLASIANTFEKSLETFEKDVELYTHIYNILTSIDAKNIKISIDEGQLFEVEIPENDVLLDEQKTLFDQPEAVRKAVKEIGKYTVREKVVELNGERFKLIKDSIFGEHYASVDQEYHSIYKEDNPKLFEQMSKLETKEIDVEYNSFSEGDTGRTIYGKLIKKFGSAKAASLALKEQGVLGITYEGGIDGRCFVIWDEDAIQIYNTLYQAMQQAHDQQLDQAPDAFARGAVTDTGDQYFIELFKGADLSTLFHELSHTYWLSMEKYVRDGLADAEMVSDWEKLCKWLGATPGQALTIDQHEMLARGWEGYFMEGKAPSVELEGVFQRIKRWFLRIYRDIKALNVELTDEVRGVFDRMLATQEEIEDAAAQTELVDLTTGELQAMGVSPVQMAYTRRVLDEAKAKAAERLQQKRDQERKARLADYRRQAHEELSQLQHNVARSDMRKTPIDLDAVRALMGDDVASALMKKQPGAFKKGGMDPGQFAMQHGYQTAEDMLADLASAKTLGEEVEDQVKRMDAEFDAQFDATDELLDTEEVAEHASLVARHLANIAGRPYIQQQAVNKVALQEMQAMSMTRAMRVGDFRANMRRALRDERRAIANGKYAEALEANTKARLNLEMARIAQELREDVDRTARQCKRFAGSKSIAEVPKAFLAKLVQRHSFLGPDWLQALVEKYSDQDILAWQKAVEADGYTMQIDDEVYLTQTPWRDMTMEQWESFSDALRQVITIERNQRKILTAKGKQDLEDIAQEIEDSLIAHNRPKVNGRVVPDAVRALRKYHAIHMKVEQMCLLLDGGKPGPMWNYIYKPIADAADDQALRLRDARDYLRDKLFGMFSKQEFKQLGRKEWVQSVGRSMTKEERLCVALNMGNSVNLERIRSGFGWTDAQISDVVSTLTAKDWEFVQKTWDYINTFREPAFKVHQEITGSRPTAVDPDPLDVETADGKKLRLKGGYYPIRYDPVESSVQYARDQQQLDQQLMGGRNHGAAQTRHGHLRERTEGGLGSPLLLNFDVLTGHIFNTIHDFTHRKAVLDVAKIIRNRAVMGAIETYGGREAYQELMPWLQDVANETQTPQSSVQRMASWARSSATIMQMGYKLTTIVMVPTGITQSVAEIGWGWTACGYRHVIKALGGGWEGVQAMWEDTKRRSAFMASRIENFDRDVRDFSKRINAGPVAGWIDRIRNNAFLPMGYYQLATVDLPTWWGAFEQGLHENAGDEEKAAAYADSVVRLTQASGATKDLARVQRGSDIHRMLTMFYSYFNTLYNLGTKHIKALREDHSPAGIWRAANAAILLWFLPSVLSELVAFRGPDDGDDDPEGWLKWASKIWLQYPFQSCVFIRDVASAVFSEFGYQLSPAQGAPASLVKFFKSIDRAIEEEDPSLMVKPTAEAVGYALKLPGKQPIITAQNMWEYCTDPNSEFYLRDLFFVKPKSRQSR